MDKERLISIAKKAIDSEDQEKMVEAIKEIASELPNELLDEFLLMLILK